jgi:CDP-diacylglycerol--serine O-phosphatidyltransferase
MLRTLEVFFTLGWPVMLMFAVERFIMIRFVRTEAQKEWVRAHKWLHPNSISYYRYPMGFVTVLLMHYGMPLVASYVFAFWMITDLTDGDIARRCNLGTEEGKTIDPLSDKLMYIPPLVYLAFTGIFSLWSVGAFVIIDVLGQFTRVFIKEKSANLFGKAKTFVAVILLMFSAMHIVSGPLPYENMLSPLMNILVALAFCSAALKIIPNYWYANILSILNMVCGLAGIVVILRGQPAIYAFGLVFLGQFLDLFDGRAAEKWGSTPRGEIFDDVADGTSFGGTVALIVATSFADMRLGIALGAVHLVTTILRLIRFVIEKRKAGEEGGVGWFSGMPSPAGALLAGCACLYLDSEIARAAMVILCSLLMISRVPYAHFGRVILPKVPKLMQVVILAVYMVILAQAIRLEDYEGPLAVVFIVSVVYLISPLWMRKPKVTVAQGS